ncbi:hypothetical protein G4228_002083, partial [Cervus hanglu yarkandensis]
SLCLLPTVPQDPDPFYYDYDTVQTVGMTLATILFLLGILIILSKCDPFLGSKAPPRGLLGVPRHLQFPYWLLSRPLCPVSLFCSLSLLTGKKVKCRKADSRSESPTCKSCKSELPSSGEDVRECGSGRVSGSGEGSPRGLLCWMSLRMGPPTMRPRFHTSNLLKRKVSGM